MGSAMVPRQGLGWVARSAENHSATTMSTIGGGSARAGRVRLEAAARQPTMIRSSGSV
jgi:hypothetical protein